MNDIRTRFWLFLLLLCPNNADWGLSATQTQSYSTDSSSSFTVTQPSLATTDPTVVPPAGTNDTQGNCLIDTEMGLIAIGSAGGLILCLLAATVVLACQICHIQRRVYLPRSSRSNMDLVSSPGYWDTEQPEAGGLVGPCDASVMLEEVKADDTQAETHETKEAAGEAAAAFDPEDATIDLTSNPRDSCLEIPRDLEDMPLVV